MNLTGYLHAEGGWETDEVGTDTETSTGSSRDSETGNIGIQDAEGGSGSKSNQRDLIEREAALRDSIGSDGDHNTFHQILNGSLNEFA
jgi:hypothetical protein